MSSISEPSWTSWFEQRDLDGEPYVWPDEMDGIDVLSVGEQLRDYPSYVAIGRFAITDHGPQLVGLSFAPHSYPTMPPPMLTAAMVRNVSLDRLYELVRDAVAISSDLGIYLDVKMDEFARHPRPGRVGRPDVFYAQLAAQYVELLKTSATPTKLLAEMHHYSETSMRDYLHQARERGLLTRAPKGKSGGELTDKAREMLNVS